MQVIAATGQKQVGQTVSAERGELVTFCGIIGATGNTLPPIFVFPRVRFKETFMNGAPAGSLGLGAKTGWMNSELFLDVLAHIKKHTQCSKMSPLLLLLDNHVSHTSLAAIVYAKENGIILLSFPPHCTHRMQPLDVGVYGPFKAKLKVAFNDFMLSNPGKTITVYDIPKLTNIAFTNSFTIKNIVSAFKTTGIYPVNQLIFSHDDFDSSYATDRPEPAALEVPALPIVPAIPEVPTSTEEISNNLANNLITLSASSQSGPIVSSSTMHISLMPENCASTSAVSHKNSIVSPEVIRPFPKATARKKTTNRQRGKSRIYTDSPERARIEEMGRLKMTKTILTAKKSKAPPKVTPDKGSSSEESEISMTFSDSDIDSDMSIDSNGVMSNKLLDSDILQPGDFVLIRFSQKQKDILYAGQIIETYDHNDFDIKFLRKAGSKFVFPMLDDITQVSRKDIECKLPKPNESRGTTRTSGHLLFEIDLSQYNIR